MLKLLSIADFISLTNAIFGFFSILILFTSFIEDINLRFHISFSFILLGLLADGLDGIVARRFGKSEIGEYLEAMADMTTLVIAPAVFVYMSYSDILQVFLYKNIYLLFALLLFVFFFFFFFVYFFFFFEKIFFVFFFSSLFLFFFFILYSILGPFFKKNLTKKQRKGF